MKSISQSSHRRETAAPGEVRRQRRRAVHRRFGIDDAQFGIPLLKSPTLGFRLTRVLDNCVYFNPLSISLRRMCKRVICPNDAKPTWWGCGEYSSQLPSDMIKAESSQESTSRSYVRREWRFWPQLTKSGISGSARGGEMYVRACPD